MSVADTTNLGEPIHHYGDQFRSIVPSSLKGELVQREELPQAGKKKLLVEKAQHAQTTESIHWILLFENENIVPL